MTSNPTLIDLDHLRKWVGREYSRDDSLAPFPARALAATLDCEDVFESGDALPPAWHWLYFLEAPRASATGKDGHPSLGGFLPPVPLPRRMWAAGNLDFLAPLTLGSTATRKTVIRSVDAKIGRDGTLVFVTLHHDLSQQGRTCIREEQNLVYRQMPTALAPLPPGQAAPTNADFSRTFQPDPVVLFRYSALTYNGHRIHYDRTYAVEQEFYPALVVHGPLLATLLLDLVRELRPQARVENFRFRAIRPAFDTEPLTLSGKFEDNLVTLWTADAQGQLGMSATARLA